MALVTSNSTTWPRATAPSVERTGPSIAGRVFQVTVRSSQAQLLMGWMRAPATLWEFSAVDTCMRRRADVTWRAPTPPTRMRRNVCFLGLASTSRRVVAPKFRAGAAASTYESASTTATVLAGHGPAGSPTQLPPAQVSRTVQASPAVQVVPLATGGVEQMPFSGLQVPAVWHWSGAGQATAAPWQTPPPQLSPMVQALPSLHAVPSATGGFKQLPVAGSHVPARWHWSDAAHVTGVPVHAPAWQLSPVVHRLPSLQAVPLGATGLEQVPVAGSQVPATWHWSDAGQATGIPAQRPAWQVSPVVQRLPSEHGLPLGSLASSGHVGPFPGQNSATSHGPAAGRHSVAAERKESPGQLPPVPSQTSATSHGAPAGRQTVPALAGGCRHVTLVPSH